MASQIAHVIYADKFFKKLDSGKISDLKYPLGKIDRDEFILGSVFPDMRLMDKNIRRQDTHIFFDEIDLNFSGLNSFKAGWKFHLYCDMKREEILNKYNFYSLDKVADFVGRPAKFLEDEIIYDEYNNWEKLVNYFNNPPSIDVGFSINEETFKLWYAILAKYMEAKPDIKSIKILLSKIILKNKEEIADTILKLQKNKKAIEILLKIKKEII